MYWSMENVPWTNLHDLNLDWIVNTMKQTVEQWIAYQLEMNQNYTNFTEQINNDFDDFTEQINNDFNDFTAQINEWKNNVDSNFSDLQQYVQDYFDNLDLNESTRYVINQMIASGEFVQVLNPSIVSATETWLASHITPTSPAVDNTLAIEGAAADAKVTGEKVADLKNDLKNDLITIRDSYTAEIGLITENAAGLFRRGYYPTNNPSDPSYNVPVDLNTPNIDSSYCCTYLPCSKGDVFKVKVASGAGSQRAYVILDSNKYALFRSGNETDINGDIEITQENAAYICVNNKLTSMAVGYYLVKGKETLKDTVNLLDKRVKGIYGTETPVTFELGGINSNTGENSTATSVIRTAEYLELFPNSIIAQVNNVVATRVRIYFYDENCSYLGYSGSLKYGILKCNKYAPTRSVYYRAAFTDGLSRVDDFKNSVVIGRASYSLLSLVENNLFPGAMSLSGKTVAIIGDSISTNGDLSDTNQYGNVPEIVVQTEDVGVTLSAYVTYYDIGKTVGGRTIVESDVGTEITFVPSLNDVGKTVGEPKNNNSPSVETWWEVCMQNLGFKTIPVCWSGASITSHEGNDLEYKTSYGWHPAQIRKCGVRTPGTMNRTAPDVVIIYRGVNDFSHSPYTVLTDVLDENVPTIPQTDIVDNKYGYIEGLMLTISKVLESYPNTRIMLCTFNYFRRLHGDTFPTNNYIQNTNPDGVAVQKYNDAIRKVADFFGFPVIEFDKDGLNYWNASSLYYQDSADTYTHPTTAGHKIMGNRALIDIVTKLNAMI